MFWNVISTSVCFEAHLFSTSKIVLCFNMYLLDMMYSFADGLTDNDFILAAKINGLDLQHLLRRKAAAT